MKNQKGHVLLIVLLIAAAIGGYLIYSGKINLNKSQTAPSAPTATTSANPSSTSGETANWKTYTNTKYGYVIKYPGDWSFSENQNSNPLITNLATFQSDSTCNITDNLCSTIQIYVENNDNKNDLTSNLTVNLNGSNPDRITNKTSIKINGKNASEFDFFGANYRTAVGTLIHTVVVNNNGKKYVLSFLESSFGGDSIIDSTKWKNKKIFNQILSTFKFLDQNTTDIPDWKTYTDKTFNFNFKYPSNWKIDQIPNDTLGAYINFFEEGVTQIPTTNMHTRGNEVFRIMLYGDETIFNNLKEVKPIPPTSITVSGKPALKSESQIDILVNNKVLHLEIITNESKKYIDQILSTFKFTN